MKPCVIMGGAIDCQDDGASSSSTDGDGLWLLWWEDVGDG